MRLLAAVTAGESDETRSGLRGLVCSVGENRQIVLTDVDGTSPASLRSSVATCV